MTVVARKVASMAKADPRSAKNSSSAVKAAAFLGLALLAAAPDAAAHIGGSALHNLTHPHHLNNPRIITS